MKNINKNVSLAGDNRINITEDMKVLESIVDVFKKEENSSYSICFLGSNSDTIFDKKDGKEPPITQKYIVDLVNYIFQAFLNSDKINNLKIVTTGGDGIQKLISQNFSRLRIYHKNDLISKGKYLQNIAVTIDSKKNLETNPANDYSIRTESATSQNQAMINLSYLFIGLPGGKATLSSLLMIYNFLEHTNKNQGEYRLLLHSFWKKMFEQGNHMISEVSIFTDFDKLSIFPEERVSLKEIKPTKQEKPNLESLKKAIVQCISKGKSTYDAEKAILAIDFSCYIDIYEKDNFRRECYSRGKYEDLLQDFFKEWNDILFSPESENTYGVTILPDGVFSTEYIIEQPLELRKKEYKVVKTGGPGTGTFEKLAKHFNNEKYGQTLMWRRVRMLKGDDRLSFSIILLFHYHIPIGIILTIKRLIEDFITVYSTQEVVDIFSIKNNEIEKADIELEEKINLLEKQARKSAYSQVFIRNMSHNIISHVLIHLLKGEELSEQKLPTHIERANAYQASFDLPWKQQNRTISLQDSQEQLACFLKYLSDRCFYLNESVYGITNTVGEKKVYQELFRELDENRILLNHISGIEHFNYKLHFVREIEKEGVKQYEPLTSTNDFSVMLPGDTLGQQAFYNIIENIIRNTAKHNSIQKVNQCVHFIIKFSEHSRIYYKVEIFDSVVLSKNKEQDLNRMISDPEFDNNEYRLRSYGLGQLEMKAAAAFLRQKDITQLETNEELTTGECLPFLKAFETGLTYDEDQRQIISKEKEKHLGYSFYLKKTEKYLIIINEDKKCSFGEKLEKLSLKGVQIVSQEDFLKDLKAQRVFNHEFVFLCESAKENLKELSEKEGALKGLSEHFYSNNPEKRKHKLSRIPILSLLPERLMLIKDGLIDEMVEKSDIETFEKNIWKQWEGEKLGKESEKKYNIYQVIAINGKKEDNEYNNYSSCRQVVLHNHLNSVDSWEEAIENINIDLIKVEPLSSAAQRKLPNWTSGVSLKDYVGQIAKQVPTIQKIIEAYFNKIIVIDERIQDFAETATYKGVPEKDIFKHINVLIPDKIASEAINLANRNISQEKKKVETYIQTHITSASFLVIHYGILERMYGSDYTQINKKLEDWAKQTRVVITTGRGKYSLRDLPQAVTYLNFSALRTAFIDNRNKYSMNYILNQARK